MKKVFMFLSAFLPMFWIILIKDYSTILIEAIKRNVEFKSLLNIQLFACLIVTIVITIVSIVLITRNKVVDKDLVIVNSATNKTTEYFLGYFSLFILALMGFSFTSIVDIIVIVILLILLGVVYIKNELFFINPTINLLKSFIYEVEYYDGNIVRKKILICNEKIVKGSKLYVDLSDYDFSFARREKDESNDKD